MFSNVDYTLKNIAKGAFLVSGGDAPNPMTIGWGMVGVMWNKPVFVAPVRDSRFTKQSLDASQTFTICVPYENEMKHALSVCGTLSGKNVDKFEQGKIKTKKAKVVNGVVIEGCKKFYECKVVGKFPMQAEEIKPDIMDKWYKTGDLHTLYFGEIVAEYTDLD